MKTKPRVLTLSSNDQGISWGPAIHYLELWNEVAKCETFEVSGHVPSWTKNKPIIEPRFGLQQWAVPNIRGLRQVFWDFYCLGIILFCRYDILYLRLSNFHVLSWLGIKIRNPLLALELNGLAKPDQESAKSNSIKRFISVFFEKLLIKEAKTCFSVSESIKAFARSYAPNTEHILVDNGVAEQFFEIESLDRSKGDKVQAIYVGTFTPWDGASDIVDLAARVPDVVFLMVGDGVRRPSLEEKATKNVTFCGWVPYSDLATYYMASDVALVLYEKERHVKVTVSSLKTREYIASGLPVFSTKVPGQEFIGENGYGVLCEEPTPELFLAFLQHKNRFQENLIRDRNLLREKFSWSATAKKTVQFLQTKIDEE